MSDSEEPTRDRFSPRESQLLGDGFDAEDRFEEVTIRSSEEADLLFLDSLLSTHFHPDPIHTDRLIQRSLIAITGQSKRKWLSHAVWKWSAVAASLLVLLVLDFGHSGNQLSAREYWAASLADAELPIDREYEIYLRGSRMRSEPRMGRLYVRGADRIAVVLDARDQGEIRFGWNGSTAWFVPALERLPVLVGSDESRLAEWLQGTSLELPYLKLTTIMEKTQDAYEIELDSTDPDEIFLTAKRHSDSSHGADRIKVLADRHSGTILDLRMEWWPKQVGTRGARIIHLRLLREKPLPDSWYKAESHHSPERRTRFR